MNKTADAIDLGADILDVRDIIARVEYLQEDGNVKSPTRRRSSGGITPT